MTTKKVACLYRVSTKGQVDKNDIPEQKIACHKFIQEHSNWILVKEYYEKGVSGFKKSAAQRDILQQAKSDTLQHKFDILLVFMFDRLGRKEDETPFVVEWFNKQGVETWSTQEGQQKFDNHIDKLMNYIRFWQASGESEKTSIRVDVKHEQMVQEGLYRGGIAPYGYDIVPSGKFNKKKKEVSKLIINKNEAQIVKQIYNYVYEYGLGNTLIAQQLNKEHIPSSSNTMWRAGVIGYILRNPIYKGYLTYRKSTRKNDISGNLPKSDWILSQKANKELIIINEKIWDEVQKIREAKKTKNNNCNHQHRKITKSPLLFVGIISCGYCGHALTTNYNIKYNKDKTKKYHNAVYRCNTKAINKNLCKGQTTYSGNKIDSIVLNATYNHLKQILETESKANNKSLVNKKQTLKIQLTKEENNLQKSKKEKELLLREISNCLMGNSKFKQEDLSELISIKEKDISNIKNKIKHIQDQLNKSNDNQKNKNNLQHIVKSWDKEFLKLDLNKQKMILRQIIKHITVYRDNIEIQFYEDRQSFISLSNN